MSASATRRSAQASRDLYKWKIDSDGRLKTDFTRLSACLRLLSLQKSIVPQLSKFQIKQGYMAGSASSNAGKKLLRIDISSDTLCLWCLVGKKNLDKAIASSRDKYDFEIRWHPFLLEPSLPKGVNKEQFFRNKFGASADQLFARMNQILEGVGLKFNLSGLIGNSLDSHRLMYLAGQQGLDKQHNLMEELSVGFFTQGKHLGDREFLVEAARKAGVEGAAEFLENPNNGLKEVYEEINKYSAGISGVPHYVINGKHRLSGGQPPDVFLRAFQKAARDN